MWSRSINTVVNDYLTVYLVILMWGKIVIGTKTGCDKEAYILENPTMYKTFSLDIMQSSFLGVFNLL